MPHFYAECTDNLRQSAQLEELFSKVHHYLAETGIFPLGGLRSRAIWLDTWRMADGADDYAFVHMTLKIGAGRDHDTKKQVGETLFTLIRDHFAELMSQRYLAISFELTELEKEFNYKTNNVHQRFKNA